MMLLLGITMVNNSSAFCPCAVATQVAFGPSKNGRKMKPSQSLGADCPSWLSVANFAILYCTDQWEPGNPPP